jgi:FMN phosphatase YigB (HAD superfamily)
MSHVARRAVRKARAMPAGVRRVVDQQQARSTVQSSGWFDGAWYLRQYPELLAAGVTDPLGHYIKWGAPEGRSPGPDFDADAYRIMNPAAAGHPLLHYLARARRGGVLPAPGDCVDPDHPVLRSGCFDPEWYCRTYGDAVRTDIHPLVDYVWHGIAVGRSPGPVFHGPRYLHEFPDSTTWRSPVHHFLEEGRAQGMFPTGLDEPGDAVLRGPLLLPRGVDVAGAGSRIAVVVHAFYVDVLADLLESVATLPAGFHLFMAVRERADVARAASVVGHVLGPTVRADIRVTPNRGRNFGPLLFEFHDDVLAHDYVLHLHTKKSAHLGGHGDHWRRHQARSLAGSPAITDMVLSLLESDPKVGVVHPSPFWQLPYWVCHWLGNGRLGAPLLARLGIDAPAHGWVDYPVGGMFWARVDALRPLFEAGITADDFEEEPAGTDGTLAHAVERVINITARHRGYHSVEFDRDTAQWRDNWSTRNAPRLEELPFDHLREQVLGARLVSVDLFDTLDLRPTLSPTTLQYFAARHLLPASEAEAAVRDRLEAEATARRAPEREGDVGLREIHRHLAAARSDADELIRLEQEIEHACAVPRPSVLALLLHAHAAGVRIVLMSDTTLPRLEIEQLLSEVGAGDLFDELYLSNEMLARKDTGTMWQVVEQLEPGCTSATTNSPTSRCRRPWASATCTSRRRRASPSSTGSSAPRPDSLVPRRPWWAVPRSGSSASTLRTGRRCAASATQGSAPCWLRSSDGSRCIRPWLRPITCCSWHATVPCRTRPSVACSPFCRHPWVAASTSCAPVGPHWQWPRPTSLRCTWCSAATSAAPSTTC